MLKGSKKFKWMDKCEQTFLALKEQLGCLSLLSKPIEGEMIHLDLIVSEEVVSVTLTGRKGKYSGQSTM